VEEPDRPADHRRRCAADDDERDEIIGQQSTGGSELRAGDNEVGQVRA
jgi:hypothetical protein